MMNKLELYFWILLPVYIVGALTIANWLASHVNRFVYIYKEKKIREKDNI